MVMLESGTYMPSCGEKIGQVDINRYVELGGSAVEIFWEQDKNDEGAQTAPTPGTLRGFAS